MNLAVATCQFPVDANIRLNCKQILRQMETAKVMQADVAHFPEGALSGYAGTDFASFDQFDWPLLESCSLQILEAARRLKLWVILGSCHRLTGRHKPHNCLYIINNRGQLADRYDKMFCAGNREETAGDLLHYSPGNYFCVFTIKNIVCGTLICHEYRYPELYREYQRQGVQFMFHSYHAGHMSPERERTMREQVGSDLHQFNPGSTLPEITMPAAMHTAAANNYMWISCSNTSARESCWPSFMVRPDGVITGRLHRNRAGTLLTTIDTKQAFYDSTVAWRDRAVRGIWHSGTLVRDIRSDERKQL